MRSLASAFYHDPPIWLGSSAIDWEHDRSVDFESFDEELFRSSLSCGIEVKVTREGLFSFSFEKWRRGQFPDEPDNVPTSFDETASIVLRRTYVMNAFLAFFHTAVAGANVAVPDRLVVTPEIAISLEDLSNTSGMGFGNSRVSHLAASRFESTYRANRPMFADDRLRTRGAAIPIAAVEQAAKGLEELIESHGEDGLLLADLFLRSTKAYQDHNHSLSLITSWAVIEKLLSRQWRTFQDANTERDGKPFINRPRRERLQDGRTFTAAVIVETLSLSNWLDHQIYLDLNKIRKARNDWMHDLRAVDAESARLATSTCAKLMFTNLGIELLGATGLKIHS